MPISHDHKLIFVHIPKTGGTSVEYVLGMHGSKNNIGIIPYKNQKKEYDLLFGSGLQHLTIFEIQRMMMISRFNSYSKYGSIKHGIDVFVEKSGLLKLRNSSELFDNYYKFSIVRNPFDRLLSFYSWKSGSWLKKENPNKSDFKKFISGIYSCQDLLKKRHLMPQYLFIFENDKLVVDFILRFETLNNNFKQLCKTLGIECHLNKRMVSFHDHYIDYYDSEDKEKVSLIYKKDLELLKYTF